MMPFRLVDAYSAADAAALLRMHGPLAQPIASGGDLLGLLKEGVAGPTLTSPTVLVNLATAIDLSRITRRPDGLQLGAMTTLARLREEPELPPMLVHAIDRIASPQLRVMTTLGGNLLQRPRCMYFRHPDIICYKKGGTGCPAVSGPAEAYPGALFPGACHAGHPSDLAPVLVALNAQVEIAGCTGSRLLPLIDLYRDAAFNREREVQLAQDEILSCVIVPRHAGLQAFEKIAPRLAGEFSWASAAVVVERDCDRTVAACIVLGGVAPGPWVCERTAELLVGRSTGEIDTRYVARQLIGSAQLHNSNKPRAVAAEVAIERALCRVLRCSATDRSIE